MKTRAHLAVVGAFLTALIVAQTAVAVVSISRAELSGDRLKIEGSGAVANAPLTVDGVEMGQADGSGNFKIERRGFSDADCTVAVDDGTGAVSTTLSGCSPTTTTEAEPSPTSTSGPSFVALGSFAPGEPSLAHDVSGDGSTVVGFAYVSSTEHRAFRWTAAGGLQDLGAGTWWANAASSDGGYVAGRMSGDGQLAGFRWNAIEGLVQLPILDVLDLSDDGSVAVCCAVRWKNGTTTFLPNLGACCTQAQGVSGDGVVVVGGTRNGVYEGERAFRWSEASGIHDLGVGGVATAASRNGSVIVGRIVSGSEWQSFRWTSAGVQTLKSFGGTRNTAHDVSADGSVVVGDSTKSGSTSSLAYRWTAKKGTEDLRRALLDAGVEAVDGWRLATATGVSADGTVISGYGLPPNRPCCGYEAFRAVLPLPR